jgi:hypothetical protein
LPVGHFDIDAEVAKEAHHIRASVRVELIAEAGSEKRDAH